MNISKGFVKAIWFIICVILVIMLGNNYKFVEMFLMVTLGIIGFILIENFYKNMTDQHLSQVQSDKIKHLLSFILDREG